MSFFEELKRRNVVRVGLAYIVIGWVIAQAAELAFDTFGAPDWVMQSVLILLLLGLPLALFFAWAFEMTPEGVKRERDVDRSQSITTQTGRKLDFIIIGVLGAAVTLLLVDKFFLDASAPYDPETTTEWESIAVLPFQNMSDDNDHFSDGLTEEILNVLAKNSDLRVAGRTSSFAFKGQTPSAREVGDALNVDHYLEGSVRRSDDTLRVTAQLIKVEDGFHVWSETYDRQMADIFDIQDDVAAKITNALELQLTPVADRPTNDPRAYALYLEALALVSGMADGNAEPIVELLDRALTIDSGFAKAYELKAIAYWNTGGWTIDSPVAQTLVFEAATAALAIDPNLPIASVFSISANPDNWGWSSEISAQESLLEEVPNNINLLGALSFNLLITGYLEEALALADRAIALDPLASLPQMRRAYTLAAMGRRNEAIQAFTRIHQLGDPVGAFGISVLHNVAGDYNEAIRWGQMASDQMGGDVDIRAFYERALDPDSGKEFVIEQVKAASENAPDFETRHMSYNNFMSFGYLDELYARLEELQLLTDASWDNTDTLIYNAIAFRRSEFVTHPKFLDVAMGESAIELWEERGAPDFCSKDSGEWVCE